MNLPIEANLEREQDQVSRNEVQLFMAEATDAFDLVKVEAEQKALVSTIKETFSWTAPEQFARLEATGVSRFADSIIEGVRSSELGSVHDHLTELRMVTQRLSGELEPSGLFGRLFFRASKALEQFAADWDTLAGQIGRVVATLERDRRGSMITIENLRVLREEALDNFRRMAAAIVAGRELLAEERARLADLHRQVGNGKDSVQAAELRQLEQRADVFDRRLTNLEKSRAIAAGMIPTIQQTLHSEIIVSEELDMALTQAIPLMKQQLALVAEQVRQQERLKSLSATRTATEEMMGDIADRLGQNEELIQEQVREGIASTQTVIAFLDKIGTTLEEIDQRQTEAQKDRAAARVELESAVEGLRDKLIG